VNTDTTISFKDVPGAAQYVIRKRRTDANQWADGSKSNVWCSTKVDDPSTWTCTLKHIRVDDWVFGVSSVGKDGFESPVASAVPGGAFHPYIAPKKK